MEKKKNPTVGQNYEGQTKHVNRPDLDRGLPDCNLSSE